MRLYDKEEASDSVTTKKFLRSVLFLLSYSKVNAYDIVFII